MLPTSRHAHFLLHGYWNFVIFALCREIPKKGVLPVSSSSVPICGKTQICWSVQFKGCWKINFMSPIHTERAQIGRWRYFVREHNVMRPLKNWRLCTLLLAKKHVGVACWTRMASVVCARVHYTCSCSWYQHMSSPFGQATSTWFFVVTCNNGQHTFV